MSNNDWMVVRIRGERGVPTIDGADLLRCVGSVRDVLGEARWHHRWVVDKADGSGDGLRVEFPFGSPQATNLLRALESRVPPPDAVVAEPVRMETDLDPVQTEEERDACLTLLWRYSEFLADLQSRNPHLSVRHLQALTPGAFLTFVTGDRRHLETVMEQQSASTIPVVSLGRVIELVRGQPMPYRVPPRDHLEAVNAARIHHLAGCTFANQYYPYARAG
jgi:hypothetical protein